MRFKFFILSLVVVSIGLILIISWYSYSVKASINKILDDGQYRQFTNLNVATIQSPEQTHAKLISALKAGNLDLAAECCFIKSEVSKRKEFFQSIKTRGMLEDMITDLTTIKKESQVSSSATYSYLGILNGKQVSNFIIFVKDSDGVWRIKSL